MVPARCSQVPEVQTIIALQEDGTAIVRDKLSDLPPRATLDWRIPTSTWHPVGFKLPRLVDVLSITDGWDHKLDYSERHWRDELELRISSRGADRVVISYAVRNAVQFLRDRDEFFWTAAEGWRGGLEKPSLFLVLPNTAIGEFRAQGLLRGPGSTQLVATAADGPRIQLEAGRALSSRERLGVDVVFPKGMMEGPSLVLRLFWFIRANPIVLFPVVVALVMLVLRRIKPAVPMAALAVTPRYAPPDGLTPAEAGTLIDDTVDARDITATIVDLGVRGYIRIEAGKPDEEVVFHGKDYILRSLKPISEWQSLAPHEKSTLFHIFYGGQWTKLSSLHLRFYEAVPAIRAQIFNQLREKGMYRIDPKRAQLYRLGGVAAVFILLWIAQWFGLIALADSWAWSALVIIISLAIAYLLGVKVSPKTWKGMKTFTELRGFQEFMNTVEKDRLERLPHDVLEKYLPYAMALGVEHHWAGAFAGMAERAPEWFDAMTGDAFEPAHLSHNLSWFGRIAWDVLRAVPRGVQMPRMKLR